MNNAIELIGIHKAYGVGHTLTPVLQGINLKLNAGEFIALQGPSGSGKSTLLFLCGLLNNADCGNYKINGINIYEQNHKRLTTIRRELIGFIFQNFNLVPVMTVHENVEYPLLLLGINKSERKKRVAEILERVGLSEHSAQRPDQLSGGQKQRTAIARALIKRPRLVIADEPTANLDAETATQIIDLMHEMAGESNNDKRGTFLIATHDERMSARCEQTLHLKNGALHNVV